MYNVKLSFAISLNNELTLVHYFTIIYFHVHLTDKGVV